MYNFSFFENLKNFVSRSYRLIIKKIIKQIRLEVSYFLKDSYQSKMVQPTFFFFLVFMFNFPIMELIYHKILIVVFFDCSSF